MKKTHIYTVKISDKQTVYVRADSKAAARAVVANTMLTITRTESEELLDVKREDVIEAPAQGSIPEPVVL